MRYNTIITVLVAILLVMIAAGAFTFFGTDQPRDFVGTKTPVSTVQQSSRLESDFIEVPLVADNERHDVNQQEHYTYSVHYPSISLVGHPDLAKAANAVLETYAKDTIEGYVKNVREAASPDIPTEFTSDLTVRWNATLLSPTIVSFRFDEAEYLAGAAHPNSQVHILMYDIEKKSLLSTSDLFASSTSALIYLSERTRSELRARLTPDEITAEYDDMVVPGTDPDDENFKNVQLTKDGLTVIFNPYQVAPYARGTQEVHIPIDEVSGRLSERIRVAISLANTNMTEAKPEEEPKTP